MLDKYTLDQGLNSMNLYLDLKFSNIKTFQAGSVTLFMKF